MISLLALSVIQNQTVPPRPHTFPRADFDYQRQLMVALQGTEAELVKRPQHAIKYGANLIFAHDAFIRQSPLLEMARAINLLKQAGISRIDINVGLEPFIQNDTEVITKYHKIANYIHNAGMRLAVNPVNQGAKPPAKKLVEYQKLCLEWFPKIATEMKPDVFIVLHEPSTMEKAFGISGNAGQWTDFVQQTAAAIRLVRPKTLIGAGGLITERDTLTEISQSTDIEFMTLDIYSLQSLKNELSLANLFKANGKRVYIEETWRPAVDFVKSGVKLTPGSGIGDLNFQPTDMAWVRTLSAAARSGDFEEVTYFWSNCFFLYGGTGLSGLDPTYQRSALKAANDGETTQTYRTLIETINGDQRPGQK